MERSISAKIAVVGTTSHQAKREVIKMSIIDYLMNIRESMVLIQKLQFKHHLLQSKRD